MLKKGLFVVAAIAMLAMTAQAGEIKLHQWPCALVPQEITTIPVLIDAGYYIYIKDQSKLKIDLVQTSTSIYNYEGSCTMQVKTNFNVAFATSVIPNGVVGADAWNSWTTPATLAPSSSYQNVVVTVQVINIHLAELPGGQNDIQVATVKVTVIPV